MHLDDEVVVEHALDGSIEGAGTEANVAAGPRQDFLDDGVAVAVFVGERHQNVKDGRLQHLVIYIHCGYNFNGYKDETTAGKGLLLDDDASRPSSPSGPR